MFELLDSMFFVKLVTFYPFGIVGNITRKTIIKIVFLLISEAR